MSCREGDGLKVTMGSREDNTLESCGFSLPSPHLSSPPQAAEEKAEATGKPETECHILTGQPGFSGQDRGNDGREHWDGGDPAPDVLEFLTGAEGSEAWRRNPRE